MNKHNPLGQETDYVFEYQPELLFSIPRAEARSNLPQADYTFTGADIWTAYELSWLNQKGMPQVAIAEIEFSAAAPFLVESKSLKLYLNSFNQTQLESAGQLVKLMEKDLSRASGLAVSVRLFAVDAYAIKKETAFICLDSLDVSCQDYDINAGLLEVGTAVKQQAYCSHVFRSLCPVTGQPDWASVYIELDGLELKPESLLQYLVSFRQHQGFHEQCVEFIFQHLQQQCQAQSLTVSARFLRRGGLDINPVRTSEAQFSMPARQARQ